MTRIRQVAPLLHIINFNNLCFRVENETTLISAKNRVDLSSISAVRSYITEWPRFLGATLYIKLALLHDKQHFVCSKKHCMLAATTLLACCFFFALRKRRRRS